MLDEKKKDYLFKDVFHDLKFTDELRKYQLRKDYLTSRQVLGRFYTDEEKRKYKVKSLKRKLP